MIKIWNFNLFLIILCICIFTSVTCVCASDINDTAYGNVDDLNINGNFSELEHEIAELSPGDTYNMDRDYCYNDGDSCVHGIEIFKDNITINGNGHTMDGQNKSLFFYITGNNVQILNLTFKNCHSKNTLINYPLATIKNTMSQSPILWMGDNGVISYCRFSNNSALNMGGAITRKGNNGVINASLFENNTAGIIGGAIHIFGENNTICNCIFLNCDSQIGAKQFMLTGTTKTATYQHYM